MTDDEVLISSVKDKAQECEENAVITHTDFLDLKAQSDAAAVLNKMKNVRFIFTGGYDMAERKTVVFLPFYVDDFFDYIKESPELCPYVMLRADKDSFSKLTHRDYLGALMGLGIKREKIGDILVLHGGCQVLIDPAAEGFLTQSWESAGREKLTVTAVPTEELVVPQRLAAKEIRDTVSSLRLDNVLAAGFSVSRGKAAEAVERGAVQMDYVTCQKPDKTVAAGCTITCRGMGKCVLDSVGSPTKKGRLPVFIRRFI